MNEFKGQVILITGGSGSWGNELTSQLLELSPKEIRIFSRGEIAQVAMQRKFKDDRLTFVIGDVRDYDRVKYACQGVDTVFHMAALKHVPIAEESPYEAIKSNITGTENVIKAAIDNHVKKVVDVSTDKACCPLNLYGMTKAVGEKLIVHANKLSARTKFMCIRSGNVMGTNGSVIPFFINQIKKGNGIQITDKEMTRYFLPLSDAIKLLITACSSNLVGATIVTRMPSCKIYALGKVLLKHYGSQESAATIKEIGTRQGEKLHEVLISSDESPYTYHYKDDYYTLSYTPLDLPKVTFKEYSTISQPLMTDGDIEEMLRKGGFLE